MLKKISTIIIFSITALITFAQPANDDCSGAVVVNIGASEAASIPVSGTTVGATGSTSPTSVCSGSWFGDDVWYSFSIGAVVPQNGVTIKVIPGTLGLLGMAVYTGCGASETPISCFSQDGTLDSLSLPFLQPNTTYFIRMWSGGGATTNSGTFDIIVYENYVNPNSIPDVVLWGNITGQGDFANGLNGWVSNAITTNDNWVWEADASANGAFRTTTIVSPTASNGAALFDADFMTTSVNPNPVPPYPQHTAELISPIIDCTNFPALAVKFYQSYDALNGDCFFSYSIDGGTNWTPLVSINTDIAGNGTTPIPSVKRIPMPGASGSSQVQIKFTADMDFFNWIIDDVQLIEIPGNDLKIANHAIAPNYAMPKFQTDTLRFMADILNIGANDQTNVTVNVSIAKDSDGSIVYSSSQNFGTVLTDDTLGNQLITGVYLPPNVVESYTGVYTITSDSMDANIGDNSITFTFEITDSVFSKVSGTARNITPAASTDWTYGCMYNVKTGTTTDNCGNSIARTVNSVSFAVNNPADLIGESVTIFVEKPFSPTNIFDVNNNNQVENSERTIVGFGAYSFTGNETPNQYISVPIQDFNTGGILQLQSNTPYIVAMNYFSINNTQLRLSADQNINYATANFMADLSGIENYNQLLDVGNTGDYSTIGFVGNPTPAIQMNVTETVLSGTNPVNAIAQTICNGSTYTVGSQVYSQSGTYIDTLTAVAGCDSIIQLSLTVLPDFITTLNPSICQGQSFSFGGQTYNQTGTYSAVLTSAQGCDSTVTVNLTVNPAIPVTNTLNQTICQGQSYSLLGNSYAVAGTYIDTTSSLLTGCDSIVTLNLNVLTNDSTDLNVSICTGGSYVLNGMVYETEGTFQIVTTNMNGCDSIISLDVTILPDDSTTVTETICAGTTYSFDGTNIGTTGIYQMTETGSDGCDSLIILDLTVNTEIVLSDTLIIPIIGTTNGSIDITPSGGISPYTFVWSNGETSEDITDIPLGIYEVTITDAFGCSSTFNFDLSVNTNSILEEKVRFNFYPNPIDNNQLLNLEISSEENLDLSFQITNLLGQTVQVGNLQVGTGKNMYQIETPSTAGSYFIHFYDNEAFVKSIHLMVE